MKPLCLGLTLLARRVPEEAPLEAAELIEALTSHDAAARPRAAEVAERLEALLPSGFARRRTSSLPLSASSSLPDPSSVDSASPRRWSGPHSGPHRSSSSS